MAYDYDRAVSIANRIIEKYGGQALLRRAGEDRPCICAVIDYTPVERRDRQINPVDRLALVAVKGVTLAPNHERDSLVTLDRKTGDELETLRIVAPVTVFAPGFQVVYWELQVRDARRQ